MLLGCSEISINVIAEHVQHAGMSAWGDLFRFSVPGKKKKLLGCGLLGGISIQVDTMDYEKFKNITESIYLRLK